MLIRGIVFVGLATMFAVSPEASASYSMFCELRGKVTSPPIQSKSLQFEFLIEEARDIEVDIIGKGNPDCHLWIGRRVDVILAIEDAGDPATLVEGAKLKLERYDLDVFDGETGAAFRSIKYVRKDI